MSSMYKVIEVEGKGLRCIATTERIWPFIVNKYHYSLRFVRHLKKCVWDFEGWLFFSLILSRELLFCARAHTTSIWNFTIQWTSHDDLTEKSADIFHFKHQTKKLVKWQKFKTALCNLTKKRFRRISYLYKSTLVLKKKLSALQFNVPIQDGWMDGSPNKQDCYNGAFGAQTRSLCIWWWLMMIAWQQTVASQSPPLEWPDSQSPLVMSMVRGSQSSSLCTSLCISLCYRLIGGLFVQVLRTWTLSTLRWFHWRGECSRYILLLLLHTIDMHYHSADISPPSYQIAHPTRSTPFTHHWKKKYPL